MSQEKGSYADNDSWGQCQQLQPTCLQLHQNMPNVGPMLSGLRTCLTQIKGRPSEYIFFNSVQILSPKYDISGLLDLTYHRTISQVTVLI